MRYTQQLRLCYRTPASAFYSSIPWVLSRFVLNEGLAQMIRIAIRDCYYAECGMKKHFCCDWLYGMLQAVSGWSVLNGIVHCVWQ